MSEFRRTKCLYWHPYSKGRGNLKMPLPSGEKYWPHCWWVTIFFFSLFHVFLRRKSCFRIHSNISQIIFRNTTLVYWMSFTIFLNYSICLYNHNECLFFKKKLMNLPCAPYLELCPQSKRKNNKSLCFGFLTWKYFKCYNYFYIYIQTLSTYTYKGLLIR